MRLVLIAALSALLLVFAANSGTFLEDFNGDNLDEWHIQLAPGSPFPNLVWLEGEHLAMDTITERGTAILTWRRGFEEDWDTYTVTCRVRFMDVPLTEMKGIVGMQSGCEGD